MPIIIQRAIIDKKCRALYLTGNKFSKHSISILCDALYRNSTLRELDVSDNNISDIGVQNLTDILSTNKSTVEKLHLGSNNITDKGVSDLSIMLKKNRSLKVLMINRNNITNRGVHLLCDVLSMQNNTLEVLSLAGNTLITDSSIDSFIVMFKHNSTLKELDVKYCNITEVNSQRLRKAALEKNDFKLYTNMYEQNCFLS